MYVVATNPLSETLSVLIRIKLGFECANFDQIRMNFTISGLTNEKDVSNFSGELHL
jgi:hypothetical protein